MNQQPQERNRTYAALASVFAVAIWTAFAATAAGAENDPQLYISYVPNDAGQAAGEDLALRPNVPQEVFLSVKYPEGGTVKNRLVVVELWANGKKVATTKPLKLNPNDTQKVSFAEPKEPAKPAADKKEAKPKEDKPAWQVVSGPPFNFEIRLSDVNPPKGQSPLLQTVAVKHIMVPREYVDIASSRYDWQSKTLTVDVKAKANFFGPKCEVQLVLPPDRLPGPVKLGQLNRSFDDELSKPDDKVRLYAKNLRFGEGGDLPGYIYLNVDGYQRAFVIKHNFGRKVGPDTADLRAGISAVRLNAPPFALPAKKLSFKFEIDYTPQQNQPGTDETGVEVGFFEVEGDRPAKKAQFLGKMPRPGIRKQELLFAKAGPGGGLLLKTDVTDWTMADMDTSKFKDVSGERFVQVRLIDKKGNIIRWQDPAREKHSLEAKKIVAFVDGVPELFTFVDKPKKATQGKMLVVKARIKPNYAADFHVEEVLVYIGKPKAKGMMPTQAQSADLEEGVWVAEVKVPETGKRLRVNVLAKGVFGDGPPLTTSITTEVALEPYVAPKPVGKITGTIVYDDDKLKKTPVMLFAVDKTNANKLTLKKTVMTDKAGKYLFDDLAPGDYLVRSVKKVGKGEASKVWGEKGDIVVTVGNTEKVDLNLEFRFKGTFAPKSK